MNWIGIIATAIATLVLFISLFNPVAASSSKIQELQALQSRSNIIELDKNSYMKYVLEEPRDYDMFVYYTLSQRCEHCEKMEEELSQVAYSYIQAGKHQSNHKDSRPTFFAKIEFNKNNEELFVMCEYTSVPILALSTPELARYYAQNGLSKYRKEYEWKISSQDFFDAGKILEHVNTITNSNVELRYTLMRILMGNALIFGILGALFLWKDKLSALIQVKLVWIIGTVIIFIMCIGGTAFNMIHKVPTFRYGHDSSGNVVVEEYFQRNQRSQYAGEGYMVSMLIFLIGALFVAFTYAGRIKSPMTRELVCIVAILIIFFLVTMLNLVFQFKASHYDPTFMPPGHYQRGPLMYDQGNIITDFS